MDMRYWLCAACLLFALGGSGAALPDSLSWESWLHTASLECRSVTAEYGLRREYLWSRWEKQRLGLVDCRGRRCWDYYLELTSLERQLLENDRQEELQLLRIRYLKGIQLIQILYEKILALDHHFSGMQTMQQVVQLSNPNSYPEFQKLKPLIDKQLRPRNNLQLPSILHSNPYVSAAYSLLSFVIGEGDPPSRQEDLESVACILDFTVRMETELEIIRHETVFLHNANKRLQANCQQLFEDYAGAAGYRRSLEWCRTNDDWDAIGMALDSIWGDFVPEAGSAPRGQAFRKQAGLEFATHRVAAFIEQYLYFVGEGEQYYLKFKNLLDAYENLDICQPQMPGPFSDLRQDIQQSLEKFQQTYFLPDLQGSKLRDLLYGFSEF